MLLTTGFNAPIWTYLSKNICLAATLHQRDASFSEFSRGKQCLTNSVILLCYTSNKTKTK